jgi:hypothetical protein
VTEGTVTMAAVEPGAERGAGGTLPERVAKLEVRADRSEGDSQRTRDRLHLIEGELAAVRYLGEQIRDMAATVGELAKDVRSLSHRVVERPSPAGLSAAAGWLSFLVAAAALIYAATH